MRPALGGLCALVRIRLRRSGPVHGFPAAESTTSFTAASTAFIGTVYRYSQTLLEWNTGISVTDTLDVMQALFGIVLPSVSATIMLDFESALNPEFFEQVVTQETRRALAAVDDPERIVPWLDTGRFPHDGDPMSARDLKMLLDAAEAAGLRRFNYHHQGNLSPGEWVVISDKCGTRWDPRKKRLRAAGRIGVVRAIPPRDR